MSLVGTRVVRGKDWQWAEQDGGEGNAGTVVQAGGPLAPDHTVVVLWDNDTQANYRSGCNGYYDLRVLDSAQAGVAFDLFTCDGCKTTPIHGIRWKCCECVDFDLCTPCYMTNVHSTDHAFQRFHLANDHGHGVNVGKRNGATRIQSKGIFKGAKVVRGRDWHYGNQDGGPGKIGTVTDVTQWKKPRDAANVTWDNVKRTNNYMVGCGGKVDLKCTTAASGPRYYRDHLPNVDSTVTQATVNATGSHVMTEGDKVITFLEVDTLKAMQEGHGGWNAAMDQIVGEVGRVVKVDADGDVHVKYDPNTWALNADSICKVPQLRAGDKVRVANSREIVAKLQEGHGGWNDTMVEALGVQGKVLEVDGDGDTLVEMGQRVCLFNPAALTLETPEAERAPPGTISSGTTDLRTELTRAVFEAILTDIALGSGGQLCKAASEGNVQNVQEILQKDRSVLNHQVGGQSALHVACLEGHAAVVAYLLEMGADKEIKDEEKRTPLHYAAYGDNTAECVLLMLSANADASAKSNNHGTTPLHLAVHRDNENGVCALIHSQQCDVNCVDDSGDTPLHDAIVKRHDFIVTCIVKDARGLDPTVVNTKGFNPLHLACLKENLHAVTKLIESFPALVDVIKEDGFAPLHIATVNDHRDIATALLLSGHCSVNSRSNDGRTALALAVNEGYTEMIQLLVEHGVDVNLEDTDGDTPLHIAVVKQLMANPMVTELVAALGLPARCQGDARTQAATALYLVMHGADADYRNHAGNTPLDLCLDPKVKEVLQQCVKSSSSPQRQTFPASLGTVNMAAAPASSPTASASQPSHNNVFPSGKKAQPPVTPPNSTRPTTSATASSPASPSNNNVSPSGKKVQPTAASQTPSISSRPTNVAQASRSPPPAPVPRGRPMSQVYPSPAPSQSKPAVLPKPIQRPKSMVLPSPVGNSPAVPGILPNQPSPVRAPSGAKPGKRPAPPPPVPQQSIPCLPPPLPPRPGAARSAAQAADNRNDQGQRTSTVSQHIRRFEDAAAASTGDRVPMDVNRATATPTAGNCFICVDEAATVVFQPCGHKVICTGCAVRAKQCVVCKTPIGRKVYPEGESMKKNPVLIEERKYTERVQALTREVEELKKNVECQICMDKNCRIVFQCGHRVCEECAPKLRRCPQCNKNITDRRTFF